MIELIAAAVSGAVVGGGVAITLANRALVKWADTVEMKIEALDESEDAFQSIYAKLTALRSNCFIPDERGVKVRYSQASLARRVKAETPKEVV